MTLCTRDLASAESFALDYQLTLKDRSEITNWHQYEGVIAATHSEEHLITSMSDSRTRLILDLSVPRTVDPSLERNPELTLLNMEQIGAFFESYRSQRLSEVESIKNFLQESVEKYTALYEKKSLIAIH